MTTGTVDYAAVPAGVRRQDTLTPCSLSSRMYPCGQLISVPPQDRTPCRPHRVQTENRTTPDPPGTTRDQLEWGG